MKGTLGITPQGWKVTFEYWFIAPNGGVCDRSQLKEGLYMRELPLHPDDNPDYEFGRDVVGEEVEFEMVWYKDVKYAKLINIESKENTYTEEQMFEMFKLGMESTPLAVSEFFKNSEFVRNSFKEKLKQIK